MAAASGSMSCSITRVSVDVILLSTDSAQVLSSGYAPFQFNHKMNTVQKCLRRGRTEVQQHLQVVTGTPKGLNRRTQARNSSSQLLICQDKFCMNPTTDAHNCGSLNNWRMKVRVVCLGSSTFQQIGSRHRNDESFFWWIQEAVAPNCMSKDRPSPLASLPGTTGRDCLQPNCLKLSAKAAQALQRPVQTSTGGS